MPSESSHTVLLDSAYHIDLANQFTVGLDYKAFENDLRTVYAVIRCLEVISEASRRLPSALKQRHPSIAWRDMAAAGNIYRHEYEDVEAKQVWNAVQFALPSLRTVVASELALPG